MLHPNKSLTTVKALAFALTIVSGLLWWHTQELAHWRIDHSISLHTLLETASVVILSSVFIVCWNAFGETRKRSSVILSTTFLCASLLGLVHAISFQGMPGFTEAADLHISLTAWLFSRGLIACSLLGLVLVRQDPPIRHTQAYTILFAGLISTVVLVTAIFKAPQLFPTTFHASLGQTNFKIACEIVLISLNGLTALVLYRRAVLTETTQFTQLNINNAGLFLASILMAESEIYFSLYTSSDQLFVVVGHIYQLVAALAIYLSMVAINIHTPYMNLATTTENLATSAKELAIQKERLSRMIETAIDGIITINEDQTILLANPAAASMFGYEVDELINQSIDLAIPMRHRHNHAQHVRSFGQTGATRRKMGASYEDFYVTGLRKNGDEFPIEASISSQIEDGKRFYTVIFRDITERKLAKEQMAAYHDELSQLSTALQTIREEERKHIARELHDDLGQLLAALRMDLSLLQREQPLAEKPVKIVASMDHLILTAINSLRRIASDLRPRALDEGGLFFALQSLTKEFNSRHQISCDFSADEEQLSLDDERSTAIFRIVQESLTNVARHAHASEVTVQFTKTGQTLHFYIEDNGKGISSDELKKNRSFGLVGIRERIKALNGDFEIVSQAGLGTKLSFKLPLSENTDGTC